MNDFEQSASTNPRPRWFWIVILVCTVAFTQVFLHGSLGWLDFWYLMALSIVFANAISFLTDKILMHRLVADCREEIGRKVLLGLASALALYLVFSGGNWVVHSLFPGLASGVQQVYALKQDASGLRIAVLMILIFGPGEEIFWRGYVQHHLMGKFGAKRGFVLAALIYSLVHLASANSMLVLAAAVCGVFWGWLYAWRRSLLVNMLSHTVWDLGVFLVFPFA